MAVAEAGNFRRAAKALSLSQPGVSVHVAQLEAELGVTLLERNRVRDSGYSRVALMSFLRRNRHLLKFLTLDFHRAIARDCINKG